MLSPELLSDGQVFVAAQQTERERDASRAEQRRIALSHAVISQDVQGLTALLDDAKLHGRNSAHQAKYLLGLG